MTEEKRIPIEDIDNCLAEVQKFRASLLGKYDARAVFITMMAATANIGSILYNAGIYKAHTLVGLFSSSLVTALEPGHFSVTVVDEDSGPPKGVKLS